jgi:hypothetical protein
MTNGPFTLLARALLFGLLLLALLVVVALVSGSRPRVDYYQALGPKQERLHALGSPKLVVMGGSNGAFGMDSRALEEALCLPAVNMTLHASLGIRYMTNEVASALGSGDVVLLTLEPGMFTPHAKDLELASAIDGHPSTWRHVPAGDLPKALAYFLTMRLKGAWRAVSKSKAAAHRDPVYRAEAFDARGDLHVDEAALAADTLPLTVAQRDTVFDPHITADLTRLHAFATAAGARLFFVWPSTATSAFDPAFARRMAHAVNEAGIPIIGGPVDYVFPDTAFLDTPFHLHPWGRDARTRKLIGDLCAARPELCCGRP